MKEKQCIRSIDTTIINDNQQNSITSDATSLGPFFVCADGVNGVKIKGIFFYEDER